MNRIYEIIVYLEGLSLLQIDHRLTTGVLWHVYLLLMGLVLREMDSFRKVCCSCPVKAGNTCKGMAQLGLAFGLLQVACFLESCP